MLFEDATTFIGLFTMVREQGDPLIWSFTLNTKDSGVWTEAMFVQRGLPANWICLIEAHASCSFQMKCATGFFTTHRTVSPRKVAWNILHESQALVDDVRIEFAERLREYGQ